MRMLGVSSPSPISLLLMTCDGAVLPATVMARTRPAKPLCTALCANDSPIELADACRHLVSATLEHPMVEPGISTGHAHGSKGARSPRLQGAQW
jgi:hypothetical protein